MLVRGGQQYILQSWLRSVVPWLFLGYVPSVPWLFLIFLWTVNPLRQLPPLSQSWVVVMDGLKAVGNPGPGLKGASLLAMRYISMWQIMIYFAYILEFCCRAFLWTCQRPILNCWTKFPESEPSLVPSSFAARSCLAHSLS